MSDFDYQPAYGAQRSHQPRVKTAKFGDGYEQRAADGINTMPATWNLTFSRPVADIDAIETFLIGKGGVESFTWTPSGFSEITVLCREWSRGINTKNTGVISATFEQVFGE